MNSFRSKILSGEPLGEPLLKTSKKRQNRLEGDDLKAVPIPRAEGRNADHRGEDRHRLVGEQVILNSAEGEHEARLINLSGGGAMVECDADLPMWEKVELVLGGKAGVECVVRWIRDGRFGLEFAHETKLDCSPEERNALLREVLERNFADPILLEPRAEAPEPEQPAGTTTPFDEQSSREPRHPLIWSGCIHYNHESTAVRLRNISSAGAQIDCPLALQAGVKLLLDLEEAGTIFAEVMWARGDLVGLKFEAPFEVSSLARKKPEVAPSQWEQPVYLRDSGRASPWASHWQRKSISDLKSELEGFLKR
ncbi:PilZ domain-containing protein [Sphingomonas ginkgonis]|uniref:PilZ domain-containing protein n=1 Tax=Sphingomonas ginkgonis TaxID=2315330 RepID=A0A429VCC7_9SPHN|nr:PilZ domain-containing protein [Sphingomonas ginkgonis]RST31649.1 PilZ domain-containing protein [Sphingomonas ginkgonis]